MLDHLELAQRRFQQIRSAPNVINSGKPEELSHWLENDVCQVVDELVGRADFRNLTCWPIRNLERGSRSEERALVKEVDTGLIAFARHLVEFAEQPAIREALEQL